MQKLKQPTERWGDLLDDDDDGGDLDLGVLLPPPVVVGPDASGLKKVIEYHLDEEGNKVRVTTTTRVRKVHRSRRAIERRSWPRFGDAAKEAAGSRLTMVSTEEIFFDRTRASSGNKGGGAGPSSSAESLAAKGNDKLGGGLLMVCRTCGKKGDHWTSKCPYKDLAESSGDRPPNAGDGYYPAQAGNGGGAGAYVPVFKRLGAGDRSGADVMMRRRNDENSIRVSNLSEDARDPDLAELFGQFGHLSRVYVAIDRVTGESRGFGFVNFVHREDGERAIQKLNGYGYDNLILHVEWAAPRARPN